MDRRRRTTVQWLLVCGGLAVTLALAFPPNESVVDTRVVQLEQRLAQLETALADLKTAANRLDQAPRVGTTTRMTQVRAPFQVVDDKNRSLFVVQTNSDGNAFAIVGSPTGQRVYLGVNPSGGSSIGLYNANNEVRGSFIARANGSQLQLDLDKKLATLAVAEDQGPELLLSNNAGYTVAEFEGLRQPGRLPVPGRCRGREAGAGRHGSELCRSGGYQWPGWRRTAQGTWNPLVIHPRQEVRAPSAR
ncbi:MAG: hypothetical protein ACREMA_04605 [Longimicrobiales bacterium]